MSNWRQLHLGDVVNLKRGYDLPKRLRHPGNVPIVSSSGESGMHNEAKVKGPGVVTGRYGTLGEVFYVERDHWPLNTTLYVQDFKGNHRRFISYFLQTLGFASQNAAGAVPGVNRNHLHKLEVAIPSVTTQRKIASILSAYDDLIENNTRRIAILEEMAQAIYREWFVNFRFPGHENVKLVDSPLGPIPEGWEAKPARDVVEIRYGKNLPKTKILSDGEYPVYGAGGVIGFYDTAICEGRTALVTCRGNGSGTIWRTRQRAFVTNNSLMITPKEEHPRWSYGFVELLLKHSNVAGVISGSAQPQITIDGLSTVPLLIPSESVVTEFCSQLDVMNDQVDTLYRKNENLRTTRDLLLPKLISGKLDVEDLDIDVGMTAEALEEATA